MPFYKKEGEDLLVAPNFVIGPNVNLSVETKGEHTYPVDGWYWFDNLDEALSKLPKTNDALTVSRRQARLALLEVGMLEDIESYIDSISDPVEKRRAQIEYEADPWDRNNQYLIDTWFLLGSTEHTLDEMFALASTK